MTDYAEERRSEVEVLESIFADELTMISDDKLALKVEPEEQSPSDPCKSSTPTLPTLAGSNNRCGPSSNTILRAPQTDVLSLLITYTPTYPDEIPLIEVEAIEGEISDEENSTLVTGLQSAAEDNLGMAMVYTLASYLKDSLAELVRQRKVRIAKEEAERHEREEEAATRKMQGTKVTHESFTQWRLKFEKEMADVSAKEEQERLKALPPKEREEAKKFRSKLSGRQLFEKGDPSLVTSDSGFEEEDGVEVDTSLYERTERLNLTDEEDRLGPSLCNGPWLPLARIRSIPMYDLPYAAKCSIINIYCYTKILYYSRFLPAPKSVVKEIEDAAMLAIHGRASDGTQRRPKVSRSRLCTPLDHGGFGLIDLPRRLAIDHAKWVFQLRAPDGCFTRHLFDIRIRLQAPNEPTPFTLSRPAPNQHRRPWIWIWWAYFCHPPPKWDHAVRKTRKLLPARWVRYFEAWASVTTLNPPELSKSQNLEQWATHVLYFPAGHGIQLSVNPTLFRGPDGEVMTPSSFVNASKRHQAFIFPPIFPKGHQKVFDLPEQRWNAWWKALRKVRRVHSDAEDTGHLLSLGSLHPGSQVASPTSPHPNNRSASCVMCLSEAPECLAHLAVGCPFARRLWSALSPTPHPVFVDFVCPVVPRSERRLVELRVLFFHSIWKLCRRRRFSSDLLEPITETDFEGLRASIQESKGRLVSL
ncbi:BZ3500_MvSof-1268-A1-R1_Chr4-2g06885 [Microbotryum saponariae]|uniref:BZ3500_MvSof-1268-A1-R1_Chr4-2g06885 protein n=1 Tax=Microbotryum saponariae TaxID=289078 RepID=A0A2X0MRI0_9BASI|nr:BZ3500_MvSof-1268-A1-R1_Chr4-2g06885 [Microbotryum saponariae]SDA06550.1 BZ3501_MvSof-1269-A2-R1_Chr4-2g06596 [Microbotryum saponariae]